MPVPCPRCRATRSAAADHGSAGNKPTPEQFLKELNDGGVGAVVHNVEGQRDALAPYP